MDSGNFNSSDAKPYAPSCERNKEPILNVLKRLIKNEHKNLLEIGSGTGQHAVFFAQQSPHLNWTCSDVLENHHGIKLWLEELRLSNTFGPIEYEIGKDSFPNGDFDLIFTANTFHIMSWDKCKELIKACGENLKKNTLIIIYGPFNYDGDYTSHSNAQFDIWLKGISAQSAIREFEEVDACMNQAGFKLVEDTPMPSNNRVLVFKKHNII